MQLIQESHSGTRRLKPPVSQRKQLCPEELSQNAENLSDYLEKTGAMKMMGKTTSSPGLLSYA